MGIPTNYPGLTPEMVKLIKSRAYNLSRGYGHSPEDREDLEQDMALHLLASLPKYDPKKGKLSTFADRVIDYWTTMYIEKRHASCRDYHMLAGSLDSPCLDVYGETITLGDTMEENSALCCADRLGSIEAIELKIDVERVIETLNPRLQDICRSLMTQTVTDLCTSQNRSRTSISFHIKTIRKAFEKAGLGPTGRKKNSSNF